MAEDPDKPPHSESNGTPAAAAASTNGPDVTPEPVLEAKGQEPNVDLDAQQMVIASLRTQVQDLFTQVTQLNGKLVNSYDRVSDLEDDLHSTTMTLKSSNVRISQLEMERTQHLAALNTGLLVEKSHVTTELNRLMEKATEEAAQRGQAESARAAIEKDLDDLSASLFDQANTMVAEARFARHLSEEKVTQAQQALRGAEEAVSIMQAQMQLLQSEKEEAERKSQEMQAKMGKGKWLERIQSVDLSRPMKLMSSHLPYQEFLLFVAHLRSLHLTSQAPPAMTTILSLPFLARIATEDSEQTLRLDLAPSLNWLSRRSVQSAVHTGQLTIEPISVSTLLAESSYSSPVTVAGLTTSGDTVPCALCGASITTVAEYLQSRSQRPSIGQLSNASWSGSFFKRQTTTSSTHGTISPTQSITAPGPISISSSQGTSEQIYIFRVAPQPSTSISSSLPIPSSIAKSLSQGSSTATSPPHLSPMNGVPNSTSGAASQPVTIYPLCTSGWCLRRLRSTCTMWAFVRTGIVERVWEEELPSLPPQISTSVTSSASTASPSTPDKPPIPPRKRGLWGFASAIGERAASWTDSDKKLHTPTNSVASPVNGTPPPVPPRRGILPFMSGSSTPSQAAAASHTPLPVLPHEGALEASHTPPPLPRRSEGRKKSPPTPKAMDLQKEASTLEEKSDETHSPPSTPTNKLLFDADSHQSPMKKPEPLPLMDDVVAHSESAAQEVKVEEAVKKPISPPAISPTSPVKNPNRFSFARSVPLPDSRPATPLQAAEGALHPPSRTASPATVAVPNGAAPPPVPRRAAARRVAPAPPSRPATPQKPQEEVKPALDVVSDKTAVADEQSKLDADDQQDLKADKMNSTGAAAEEAAEQKDGEVDVAKKGEADHSNEKEDPTDDAKDIFEDAQSQLPTPAAASEDVDPSTLITVSSTPETIPLVEGSEKPVDEATPKGSPEAEPVDRSAGSTPDVFVDAVTPSVVKTSLPVAEAEGELPPNLPKQSLSAEEASPVVKPGIATDNEVTNGSGTIVASPVREKGAQENEDHDAASASNDKEAYIGDATWEERTWKELVRLREEMFWARVGGSR